ncbi:MULTISPECIES: nuclear transport factor 2 family protein [Rhizobium]|uniref:nuclear transport factor 2 family protein n=1 Tax=Rhizobium TaxID=379 RepID=UPI00195C98B8|nr:MULTISPECIES: nuclear transport factor 2 family protein [Rhizobium]MBM7046498.1 nuclear transport factor 2 family protein [Rhizobium lusitanum]
MSDEREIQEVMARYVRAADYRDGAAMSKIFLPEGKTEIFYNNAGTAELLGELVGAKAIGEAVTTLMKPHPPRGWSHHTTHDPIIEVKGDTATLDVHFVVFNVVGAEKPEGGWPAGAFGAQGTITPIESGYYRPILKKVDGRWMIANNRIYHDIPYAF